jgi:hypothetical protein
LKREAASGGFYTSPFDHRSYPRIQILTIEELLAGKVVNYRLAMLT